MIHTPPAAATASVTIKWNTHAAPVPLALTYGTLTAVNGSDVTVRMRDGSLHTFTASQADIAALRAMIGKPILFRVR